MYFHPSELEIAVTAAQSPIKVHNTVPVNLVEHLWKLVCMAARVIDKTLFVPMTNGTLIDHCVVRLTLIVLDSTLCRITEGTEELMHEGRLIKVFAGKTVSCQLVDM